MIVLLNEICDLLLFYFSLISEFIKFVLVFLLCLSVTKEAMIYSSVFQMPILNTSGKHVCVMYTPLNPTFI